MSRCLHLADPAAVAAAAARFLGTPFVHRAAVAGAGCDCAGLVRGVLRALHGADPGAPVYPEAGPADPDMLVAGLARHLVRLPVPVPGAVVALRVAGATGPRHCGILTPDGGFIHADRRAGVVLVPWGPGHARRMAAVFGIPAVPAGAASRGAG